MDPIILFRHQIFIRGTPAWLREHGRLRIFIQKWSIEVQNPSSSKCVVIYQTIATNWVKTTFYAKHCLELYILISKSTNHFISDRIHHGVFMELCIVRNTLDKENVFPLLYTINCLMSE